MPKPALKLKHFSFKELFDPQKLKELDAFFLSHLQDQEPSLYEALSAYRNKTQAFGQLATSELLLACAPILEEFIADLFDIKKELVASCAATCAHQPIFAFKQWYVLRQAKRRLNKKEAIESFEELNAWLMTQLATLGLMENDLELAIAKLGLKYLEKMDDYPQEIERLTRWCISALTQEAGKQATHGWVSFHLPQKLDYEHLVPMEPMPEDPIGRFEGLAKNRRLRDGFKLTDHRMSRRQVLNEIDYCVYCHEHEGDFCSKGFPVKKGEPEKGLKLSPLGELETGCPLEEKISEMHVLKKQGQTIAALAMVMVDNPMCPATGHRICNDCMKACIYQKQDPVDIPQTETGILTDVLDLPWGVEIYDLLTRWNPLRQEQWVAQPYNGLKVLIMGMGPAGYTLAHHLLMEGFAVVGVDGLKIEPLAPALMENPIHRYQDIKEELDTRVMAGFGGVAEYGITVRWDKNFLKLIYICLSRRPYFQVFGGVRFGGTLLVEDAWELGFDHMALAVGAGLPKELAIPGSLAPGMRQANDFLMALQLTGAAKKNSLANLQVRLPAVVIGGGLTGIDTATEVQAYYITQVEKTLERYETLIGKYGKEKLHEPFDEQNIIILNEFLAHGRQVRAERELAAQEQRQPNFNKLIHEWGGVTVAYRGLLKDSPAYRRNHEEVIKAFEEGIYYAESLNPKTVRLDQFGYVEALVGESGTANEERVLPARAIFVATGAKPNIAYEFEHRGTFHREGMEYQAYDSNGNLHVVHPSGNCKTEHFGAFTSYEKHGHRVSFLGDTHPVFHGSVVKAIASAKRIYPHIVHTFGVRAKAVADISHYQDFAHKIKDLFSASIKKIKRHSPNILELQVRAPIATRNFYPGHFYRVQNFETQAKTVGGTHLQTEAVSLLGAKIDKEQGTLSLMVLERGASSRLFSTFKVGDPIAVMGPTGVRTKIPEDQETVMIVGGRMSAAQILEVGSAMRKAGNRVLYIGGFQSAEDLYCQEEIEAAADVIVWVTQDGAPILARRPQDRSITADLIAAILKYATDSPVIPLQEVNRILVVGTHRFLRVMKEARQKLLKEFFVKNPIMIGSVYGPMQCMLKGVCAQCLTWQLDPETGKRTKAVFTCSWNDQPLELIDVDNLSDRLAQNHAQEMLTDLWLDYLFDHHDVPRV